MTRASCDGWHLLNVWMPSQLDPKPSPDLFRGCTFLTWAAPSECSQNSRRRESMPQCSAWLCMPPRAVARWEAFSAFYRSLSTLLTDPKTSPRPSKAPSTDWRMPWTPAAAVTVTSAVGLPSSFARSRVLTPPPCGTYVLTRNTPDPNRLTQAPNRTATKSNTNHNHAARGTLVDRAPGGSHEHLAR